MIPQITFKYPTQSREFAKLSESMHKKIFVLQCLAWNMYGDTLVCTEIWRNDRSSVHYWFRGIDFAILEKGGAEGTEQIREVMNSLYPYGKEGVDTVPPLAHAGSTADHVHLQEIGE